MNEGRRIYIAFYPGGHGSQNFFGNVRKILLLISEFRHKILWKSAKIINTFCLPDRFVKTYSRLLGQDIINFLRIFEKVLAFFG